MKFISRILMILLVVGIAGCETAKPHGNDNGSGIGGKTGPWGKKVVETSEPKLPAPEWWYARREFDKNYMHWGVMRHPEADPRWEKWVLLDEDYCKAPHRRLGHASADNGCEYKFYGYFSETRGYEPASDEFCPVFVLQRWEYLHPEQSVPAVAVEGKKKERTQDSGLRTQEVVPAVKSKPVNQTVPVLNPKLTNQTVSVAKPKPVER